ncbi:response regulator [bacterium]|nr:response regulator [bacterium]
MNEFEKLYQIFRTEALERVDELSQLFELLAESGISERSDIYASILRTAHNLKGAARTVGDEPIEQLAHHLEEAFLVSAEKEEIASELIETAQNVLALINAIIAGTWHEKDYIQLIERLKTLGSKERKAREHEQALSSEPGPDSAEPGSTQSGQDRSTPVSSQSKSMEKGDIALALRVDPDRLDQLLSYSGELLISEARIALHHYELQAFYKYINQMKREKPELVETLNELSTKLRPLVHNARLDANNFKYLADSIITALEQVRMMPLHEMTSVWRRTVFETARLSKKQVRLDIQVGDTELDKVVLDNLKDAFMHLLRNAVDHGIELPAERTVCGKPIKGQILIVAQIDGNMIRLEISDDGRGLDPEKIGQAAVLNGFLKPEDLTEKSKQELLELIFLPGMSTAENVSTLSGRGVGLSIVRNQIVQLGGSVEISGNPTLGGTTFYLRIPISILSTTGLFVKDQGETYILPLEYVERTYRLSSDELKYVDGQPTITSENQEPLRLFWLSKLFEVSEPTEIHDSFLKVVILRCDTTKLGLVVEIVEGEKEFVAKRLPWNFKKVLGVNAVNIQADGSLSLVLDIPELFELIKGHYSKRILMRPAKMVQKHILVVDDSLTSRALESNILKSAGYKVTLAVDGDDAWQKLQAQSYDLMISDIQMPGLNGFELTKRLRRDPQFKDLPIILVTNLSRPEDVAAGVAAGADEYVVKGKFEQTNLLEMVAKYL